MAYEDPAVIIAFSYAIGMILLGSWCLAEAAINAYTRRNR